MKKLAILAALPVTVATGIATGAAPAAAGTAQPVQVASTVFVEHFEPGPGGRMTRRLERAATLQRGDQVVFVVNWRSAGPREFTVTNPLPRTVSYQKSSDPAEQVSVDGGRTWGRIETTRVRERDGGWRMATPEDVTHVRWRVPGTVAARGTGQILYRGVVR